MINNGFGVDNLAFLETVFGNLLDDSTPVVCAFTESVNERETAGKGWPVYHPIGGAVERLIGSRAHEANTYYCLSAVRIQERLSRSIDYLVATHVFVLDDVGTGTGSKVLPDKVPLAPTYAIETSKDNWQYGYVLREPLQDIGLAQVLLKAMTRGHGDQGGTMAAKLVRLPIGYNNKTNRLNADGTPWAVRLTAWDPERKFNVDELMLAFELSNAELDAAARFAERRELRLGGTGVEDEIFKWLKATERCDGHIDHVGFVDIVCPWSASHTSGTKARYSPYGYGGKFRFQRQFMCFHEHCKDKSLADFLRWVKENGGPDLNARQLARFLERYVLIEQGNVVRDLERSGVKLTLKEFHAVQSNRSYMGGKDNKTRLYYSKEWQVHPIRQTCASDAFGPNQPTLFVDSRGVARFNTWVAPQIAEYTEDETLIGPILHHLHYLFADENDFQHALGFIAATVHKPEERIQHALLHISPHHGTGRGLLKQLINTMLPGYVRSAPSLEQFKNGAFNEFLLESLLVVFDEVFTPGTRFGVKDRLRELITERRMMVNVKNGFKGEADIYANVMFFSNHIAAMSISKEDRRIWVVLNDKPPLAIEHYQDMFRRVNDNEIVRQFYWYLHRWLDEHPFDCGARAPRGAGRKIVMSTEDDDFSDEIVKLIHKLRLLGIDCIYRGHFTALLAQEGVYLPPPNHGAPQNEYRRMRAILLDNNVMPGGRGRVPADAQPLLLAGESGVQYIYLLSNQMNYTEGTKANAAAIETLRLPTLRVAKSGKWRNGDKTEAQP